MRYAAIDGAGALLGFYSTDVWSAASIPAGAVAISDADWASWLASPGGFRWSGGGLTPWTPPAPAPTAASALAALAARAAATEAAGIWFQPASASAPVLFATDPAAQARLTSAYLVAQAGEWPDGSPWFDATGMPRALTSAEVQALAKKAGGYVVACAARSAALMPTVTATPAADITAGWPANA